MVSLSKTGPDRTDIPSAALTADQAASSTVEELLVRLDGTAEGLSSADASARLVTYGPNAVRTHRVSGWAVLGRQLRSALLLLLAVTAVVSFFLGDSTQAIIIGVILVAGVGLGFANEYRAERTAAQLHSSLRHTAVARRDGLFTDVDVATLVPGDVVRLGLGEVVPADLRLTTVSGLECNESILTGESAAAEKWSEAALTPGNALADSANLAFMGTIVSAGEGCGIVYATGPAAQFGQIAAGLGTRQPETAFRLDCAASRSCCCGWH
jgi:Mg2+-importing ATPase